MVSLRYRTAFSRLAVSSAKWCTWSWVSAISLLCGLLGSSIWSAALVATYLDRMAYAKTRDTTRCTWMTRAGDRPASFLPFLLCWRAAGSEDSHVVQSCRRSWVMSRRRASPHLGRITTSSRPQYPAIVFGMRFVWF